VNLMHATNKALQLFLDFLTKHITKEETE